MSMAQVAAGEQLKYRDEISVVKELLREMGMRPDTEVRIFPLETGWYATVLVGLCVYIFTWHFDRLVLDEVQLFSGFFPTGGLVHERDL